MATLGREAFKDLIFHSEKGLVWPDTHHCYCCCSLNRSFYFGFSSMNMKDQINRWGSFYQRQNGVAVKCKGSADRLSVLLCHFLAITLGKLLNPCVPPYSALRNGDQRRTYPTGLLSGWNELVRGDAWSSPHNAHSVKTAFPIIPGSIFLSEKRRYSDSVA